MSDSSTFEVSLHRTATYQCERPLLSGGDLIDRLLADLASSHRYDEPAIREGAVLAVSSGALSLP